MKIPMLVEESNVSGSKPTVLRKGLRVSARIGIVLRKDRSSRDFPLGVKEQSGR